MKKIGQRKNKLERQRKSEKRLRRMILLKILKKVIEFGFGDVNRIVGKIEDIFVGKKLNGDENEDNE